MYPMYKIKLHDPSANDSLRPIELLPFERIIKIARPSIEKGIGERARQYSKREKSARGRTRVLPSDPFRRAPSRRSGVENVAGPLFLRFLFHFPFFFPSFFPSAPQLCRSRPRILVSARRRSDRRKFFAKNETG